MTVEASDILRVTAKMQSHATDDLQNVYHVQNTQGESVTDEQAQISIAQWIDALYVCINSHILNSIEYLEVDIYNITQDRPLVSQDWFSLTFGSLDADDLPHGVAFLVSMDTATKKVTGRKYFGGLPTTDISGGGTWEVALVTLFACVLLKLVGTQEYAEMDLVPGVWSDAVSLWRPFTAAASDLVPAYQRRRRPGHGS